MIFLSAGLAAIVMWAMFPLSLSRYITAWLSLMTLIFVISMPTAAKASELPGATMSILHYSQFRDVFMMAKCIEAGKADRDDFSYAYMLLNQRDPMAVMAVQAGGETLPKYLGPTLSRDLGNTIDSFKFMQGKTLDDYCKYTAIRATTPR